jgi:hypothetical protein
MPEPKRIHRYNASTEFRQRILEVFRSVNASIELLLLWPHRIHSHPSLGGQLPDERLQGQIRTGQSRSEVRRTLARIDCRQRFHTFANHRNNPATFANQTAKVAQLFARDERHIDGEHQKVRGLHLGKGFRQPTQRTAGRRFVEKQFGVVR